MGEQAGCCGFTLTPLRRRFGVLFRDGGEARAANGLALSTPHAFDYQMPGD
jgi:hypothetical protein